MKLALNVMTEVPKEADDMMQFGRLQGFEVLYSNCTVLYALVRYAQVPYRTRALVYGTRYMYCTLICHLPTLQYIEISCCKAASQHQILRFRYIISLLLCMWCVCLTIDDMCANESRPGFSSRRVASHHVDVAFDSIPFRSVPPPPEPSRPEGLRRVAFSWIRSFWCSSALGGVSSRPLTSRLAHDATRRQLQHDLPLIKYCVMCAALRWLGCRLGSAGLRSFDFTGQCT